MFPVCRTVAAFSPTLGVHIHKWQGGDTPIHAVVRAATGLISESWPHILRKDCSRYAFFRILSAVKRSTAEIQRSQTVKSLFAMQSSAGSSSKKDGQDFLTPVAALTTASMGVSPPWVSCFLIPSTFTDVPAISQLCLYIYQCSQAVMWCTLFAVQLYCVRFKLAAMLPLRKISPPECDTLLVWDIEFWRRLKKDA